MAALTTVSYWYHGSKEIKLFDDAVLSIVLNYESNRPGGLSPANHTSNILNNFIFMGIALLYRANLKRRALISLIILFLLFNVFFTGSKGGVGSLIIGLFFLIFLATPLRKKAFSLMVLTSFILFITLIIVSFISGKGFLQARATAVGGAFSLKTRLEWWGKGFEHLWGSGGLGLGVGGFPKIIDPEAPGAHSFFFSLLFDLGVIGAAIFGCIFLKILLLAKSTVLKSKDRELSFIAMCLISALVVCFIHGLVDMDYIYQPFWVVLGLLLSISNISKSESSTSHIDLKTGL
ncbi:MAG: O-antigen ligase family protein [Nitrospirota bacterium]